jgi:hypothetical protein
LFFCVPPPPSSRAVVAGVVAAATTGALLAMGYRGGSMSLPFAEMGAVALRRTANGNVPSTVLAGLAVHVTAMFVWTLVFAALAERLNLVVAALLVGAANFAASWFVARFTGAGLASVLPLGDRITFALTLMIALVVGMRYARSSSRNT